MNFEELNKPHDCDMPKDYLKLSHEDQMILCKWIRENLTRRKTPNNSHSSYGLKRLFEKSDVGFYVTNGALKGAMEECGYTAHNTKEKNWIYCISNKSPALMQKV